MNGTRSTWIAARARNAARRGLWIATIGSFAVIATMVALVVVPTEVDRQVRRQIAALPAVPDTLSLVRELEQMQSVLADTVRNPIRMRSRLVPADSANVTDTSNSDDSLALNTVPTPPPDSPPVTADPLVVALREYVTRARQSPLPESYRALAESPLLSENALVSQLLDSMERVDHEREVHAALGGPGARYAALTAVLTALGQQLIGVAEGEVSRRTAAATEAVEARQPAPVVVQYTEVDSTQRAARDSLTQQHAAVERRLRAAREESAARDTVAKALVKQLNVALPPGSLLLASLVVGLAFGYAVVLGREFRNATVSDAREVERMTSASVFTHAAPPAPRRRGGSRRRDRGAHRPRIDRDSEVFALLHLALTGVGDTVTDTEVRAQEPVIGAAVAMGVAAAATRESRAVLVVDTTRKHSVLARFVGVAHDRGVHEVWLDRDQRIDMYFAGLGPDNSPDLGGRHDLRLHVMERGSVVDDPVAVPEVILCVRQGHTSLAWLERYAERAHRRDQRIRAVVLWTDDVPMV